MSSCSCCRKPTYCAQRHDEPCKGARRVIDIGKRNADMDVGATSELCNSALLFDTSTPDNEPTAHQCLVLQNARVGSQNNRIYFCEFLVSNAKGSGLVYVCLPLGSQLEPHYSVVMPNDVNKLPPCTTNAQLVAVLEPGEWRQFSVRNGKTLYQLASGKSMPGAFVIV